MPQAFGTPFFEKGNGYENKDKIEYLSFENRCLLADGNSGTGMDGDDQYRSDVRNCNGISGFQPGTRNLRLEIHRPGKF